MISVDNSNGGGKGTHAPAPMRREDFATFGRPAMEATSSRTGDGPGPAGGGEGRTDAQEIASGHP